MAFKDKAQGFEYMNRYNRENYDRVTVMLPKGAKVALQEAARSAGVSVGEFIRQAIAEKMNTERV